MKTIKYVEKIINVNEEKTITICITCLVPLSFHRRVSTKNAKGESISSVLNGDVIVDEKMARPTLNLRLRPYVSGASSSARNRDKQGAKRTLTNLFPKNGQKLYKYAGNEQQAVQNLNG